MMLLCIYKLLKNRSEKLMQTAKDVKIANGTYRNIEVKDVVSL